MKGLERVIVVALVLLALLCGALLLMRYPELRKHEELRLERVRTWRWPTDGGFP